MMKKSEIYQLAMLSVICDEHIDPVNKLEIIERLTADKSLAEFTEKNEANNKIKGDKT